ncbi:hypothetical protein BDDG_07651 [Blastomyces dermatitidis ATCC 18188]|uniref:Uncharacterized protein n=1 Tax=Ajellomyces dermatitidis (strain ATCC 18188 / CBS 674.68) TaxID=653446 RepID=F2TN93_AJEDA|nr:hypothetical protein BDDG_07651 [Blastomyces dermatitidis ATCC 18188]
MAAFRPRPVNAHWFILTADQIFEGLEPGGLATLRVSKHRALAVISSHHQYKISGQAPPRKLDSVLPTNDIASTDGTKVISQLLVLSGKRFFEEPFKVFRGLRAIFNDHIAFGLSVYVATHFNNNESQVGFGFEKDAQGRRTIVRAGLKLFHILEAAEIDCREPIVSKAPQRSLKFS